jgi:hypothetical protein
LGREKEREGWGGRGIAEGKGVGTGGGGGGGEQMKEKESVEGRKSREEVSAMFLQCLGSSVVVHGAVSRDVTLQLTSLSQVLLDYRCRTMSG